MEQYSSRHAALGRAIRTFRHRLGVSQEHFAFDAGLDRTYVGGIERGERNLSFSKLLEVCDALGTRPSRLFEVYERELEREGAGRGDACA